MGNPWFIVLLIAAVMPQIMPGTVSLEGDVVERGTGEPVAGVHVQLQSIKRLSEITDAAGHFRFPAVPAMNCLLSALRAGFLSRGQAVTIRPTDISISLKLEMTRQAVITGKIVDQDGWALAGSAVSAAYYTTVNGERHLRSGGRTETNDLGEYRLAGLRPGKYLIQVNPGSFARWWDERYVTFWYPNKPSPAEARAIELQAGQTVTGIDFRLEPRQGVEVRGRVVWPATYRRARYERVMLRQQILNGESTESYLIAADDSFVIRHVTPGKYTLLVEVGGDSNNLRPPTLRALQTLEVSDRDIEGVVLHPVETPVRDLEGTVTFEGTVSAMPCSISLQRVGANWRVTAKPEAGESFVLPGVWPGSYRVHASCSGAVALSMQLGGKEILDSEFEIDGSAAEPILISVGSASLGHVEGTLTDAENRPIVGATLIFLPIGKGTRWFSATDQYGRIVSAVRPGMYRVYVLEDPMPSNAVDDSEFQKIHENDFAPVTVTEGANEPLKLVLKRR